MTREHEHEILDNTKGKVVGRVWWNPDKKQLEASNHAVLDACHNGHSAIVKSDEMLIRNLSRCFKNGYMTVRKVK
jgi:hypothetical protein